MERNVHAPERQAGETQAQYRERRALSKQIVDAINAPAVSYVPMGKSKLSKRDKHRAKVAAAKPVAPEPKPLKIRERKPKDPIAATWPKTKDQKAQSRPLIVLGKNRERDASKREKPKSAVQKRMDRPHRVEIVERGHDKLMRFFGAKVAA